MKDNPTIKIAHVDCTVDRDVCTSAEVRLSWLDQVLALCHLLHCVCLGGELG